MTTIQSAAVGNLREQVAANVRAEMARAKPPVRTNHLPKLVGGSQSFWTRRINGELPFTTDELKVLADLLGVDMRIFLELESDRTAGRIYFHGNESSHTPAA